MEKQSRMIVIMECESFVNVYMLVEREKDKVNKRTHTIRDIIFLEK